LRRQWCRRFFLEDDDLVVADLFQHGPPDDCGRDGLGPVCRIGARADIITSASSIFEPGSPTSFSTEMTSSLASFGLLAAVGITAQGSNLR